MYIYIYIYVDIYRDICDQFGKTCIVHTSDFANLEIPKSHREGFTDLKLSGMIKE